MRLELFNVRPKIIVAFSLESHTLNVIKFMGQ